MKLYVCYGTFQTPMPGGHACGNAHRALVDMGWKPDVVRAYGVGALPAFLNQTPGRRAVRRITGQNWVPVLVTDEGEPIHGSRRIIAWAESHPGPGAARPE